MNTRISATPSIRHAAGLVVVRSAGVMGKGIFAMRDIARGTRILDEDPLFVVYDRPLHDDRTEEAFIQDVETFCETARNLSANKLQKLDRLYYDAGYDKTSDKDRIKDWYLDEGIRDEQGRQMSEKNLIYAVMEMSRRYTIFKDSCAQVGLDGTGQDSAIFLLYSRINHSCSPNAHAHYNGTTERLTVHATRDIEAGDQIFVPYVDTACLPRDRRQELTKRFGFACECPTCTIDLAAEPLRQRMHELQRGFRRFVKKRPAGVVPMPTTPGQALRDIEEFIGILKDPSINLQNATLRNAYRAAFKVYIEIGDVPRATEYAQKDLDLTICMIGTDDTDYMEGRGRLGRLQNWFPYLENMEYLEGEEDEEDEGDVESE